MYLKGLTTYGWPLIFGLLVKIADKIGAVFCLNNFTPYSNKVPLLDCSNSRD